MANSLFSIGLSGLAAAQAGLATTGHNIGNVNTPGFSRQETLQASAFPQFAGGSFYGRGVDVAGVRRVYSEFLAAQSLSSRSEAASLESLATELGQLDDLFGDPASGLSPVLQDFFAGVNALAAHPADMPSRQSLVASAHALVARFHLLDDQMAGLRIAADHQVEGAVAEVNTLAAQIAGLNRRIIEIASASANGHPPNDLLDQRDLALGELNDLIGARAVPQGDGTYNVFLASGQALVVGQDSYRLQALPDTQDPRRLQVALELGGGGSLRLQSADVSGGKLAGVLAYRDEPLAEAQNELGRIAVVLAGAFNAQHRLGVDLSGAAGGDLFSLPAPAWIGASTNTGTATLSLAVTNAGALTASDYAVRYDGTNWTIERLADGTTQTFATLPQTVDGVTFGLAGGAPAAGDSFLVQPTRYAARDVGLVLTDPARLAAAAPIVASASLANTGTAKISNGEVDAAYPASPLATPVTLTYNAGAGTLSGFPATQAVTVTAGGASTTYAAGAPVPYTAGATFAFGGIAFSLSGAPANGDTFAIAPGTGVGDNRNAQLLAGLASRNLVGGTTTFAGALGQLVANVGSATHEAQLEHQAQATLHAQTEQAMQAVSGVNLDEEAANLQRYQQAYQAAGQVMRIASSLFDTILDISR